MARRSRTFCGCSDEKMPERHGLARAVEQRHALDRERHVDAGCAHHLDQMAEQAEAGDVGGGVDAMAAQDVGRPRFEPIMCAIAAITQRALALPRMSAASKRAGADRLGQDQRVAGLQARLCAARRRAQRGR